VVCDECKELVRQFYRMTNVSRQAGLRGSGRKGKVLRESKSDSRPKKEKDMQDTGPSTPPRTKGPKKEHSEANRPLPGRGNITHRGDFRASSNKSKPNPHPPPVTTREHSREKKVGPPPNAMKRSGSGHLPSPTRGDLEPTTLAQKGSLKSLTIPANLNKASSEEGALRKETSSARWKQAKGAALAHVSWNAILKTLKKKNGRDINFNTLQVLLDCNEEKFIEKVNLRGQFSSDDVVTLLEPITRALHSDDVPEDEKPTILKRLEAAYMWVRVPAPVLDLGMLAWATDITSTSAQGADYWSVADRLHAYMQVIASLRYKLYSPSECLLRCASSGCDAGIQKLEEKNLLQPNEVDPFGFTPLMLAIKGGYGDIVEKLIEVSDINFQLNDQENLKHCLLSVQGSTALHVAVMEVRLDFVKMLLTKGANINAEDISGFTAIDRCLQLEIQAREKKFDNLQEIVDMKEYLLQEGAVVRRTSWGLIHRNSVTSTTTKFVEENRIHEKTYADIPEEIAEEEEEESGIEEQDTLLAHPIIHRARSRSVNEMDEEICELSDDDSDTDPINLLTVARMASKSLGKSRKALKNSN
jgi:hypothetical protein